MAKEYGELEQLVNDVTSLDTARMTLRWALERLNTIEKEKADLKKNLTLAEETSKKLQLKESALTDAYSSRSKTLEEKEDFYTKLEATMSLLGEGKLDIQQLLKKEAKLDGLRKSLENEYQDKFDDLDRNQRAVIERWNARLLEVESQYAGRLAESQQKYDALRAELETGYQGRLTSLQAAFKSREQELAGKINALETNLHSSEGKLDARRAELEKEHLLKQRENEENYRKLKNMLEAGFDEKLRSMDSDHAAQVRSLETSWQTERARLMEEQRVREDQFASAQARIQEIENSLASQQEKHHDQLIKIISEKETAFRAQLAALEKEKALKEATVKELVDKLEKKASDWEAERSRLETEFGHRLAGMDAAMRERAVEMEKEHAAKKEELENILAVSREEFDREFQARLVMERAAMDEEKSRLAEEKRLRDESLARAAAKVKELESALSANREEHHAELMERIRTGEAAFRAKLNGFDTEKKSYNDTINKLSDELRRRDSALLDEKEKIAEEFNAKAAIYETRLAQTEAAFDEKRRSYDEKIAALSGRLEEAAKASALEKENFKGELSRVSSEVQALAEERTSSIRADYEARKADLENEFAARYSDKLKALEAEKARVNEALAEREKELEQSHNHAAGLDAAIAELRMSATDEKAALSREYSAEMNRALKAAEETAKAREAELSADINVLREELTEKDRVLSLEREKLVDELSKASVEAHNRTEERAAAVRAEYERRLAAQAALAENSTREMRELLAEKEALLEKAVASREEAEKHLKAAFDLERMKWSEEKEGLVAEFDARINARVSSIRADYETRKAELESEFAARYGDRLKALEAEKARVNEALAERELQLGTAYANAAQLDSAIAELRRSSSEEKAALSREYSAEMSRALKAAEEAAKAREAELGADINVLREELSEKDRVLSLEREKLVDELSKASVEAHNRTEERAAAVRAEYEGRLASLEAAAESRTRQLKEALAEKEAQLERTIRERADAERALKADFERRAAELETGISAKAAELEADYAGRRERLEADAAARAAAVDAEAALKMDFERRNWQAERARFESTLEETAGHFSAAQKEIETLNAGLRKAAEVNAAHEAAFSRDLMEAKATFDRELAYRVKDAVTVQTAHLVEALEASKARQEELAAALDERENSIRALRSEASEARRDYEEGLRAADSGVMNARREELEKNYAAKTAALEESVASVKRAIEAQNQALKAEVEKARSETVDAVKRADGIFDEMLAAGKAAQEEKSALQRAQTEALNRAVQDAVRKAVDITAQKLRSAEDELVKLQEANRDEVALLSESFNREKERMLEEMSRRENYVEAADLKIQELERDILKYRQTASGELLKQISEQDERFRAIVAEDKIRREAREKAFAAELERVKAAGEARVKQLETLLSAKEKLMAEADGFYRQKQLELDGQHSEFNQGVNKANEELFAQKQALSDKEKAVNDYRLKLERDYAANNAETEKLKAELTRAILEYKSRK
jgi:predicted  nucleic acid-binding Zn-ribbon protein